MTVEIAFHPDQACLEISYSGEVQVEQFKIVMRDALLRPAWREGFHRILIGYGLKADFSHVDATALEEILVLAELACHHRAGIAQIRRAHWVQDEVTGLIVEHFRARAGRRPSQAVDAVFASSDRALAWLALDQDESLPASA